MTKFQRVLTLATALIAILPCEAAFARRPLRYCVPANVDLNPFRKFEDGKETIYLMALLRSYISSEPGDPGVLDAVQFSPDGRRLRATVAATARWQDGTRVTAREAALGIAKGLSWRTIGSRVRVAGAGEIDEKGWESRSFSGIRYFGDYEFELEFETDISNPTGVIREALSTGSRHNRLWPMRLGRPSGEPVDVVTRYPLKTRGDTLSFTVGAFDVELVKKESCGDDDFFIYPEFNKAPLERFDFDRSPLEQTITAQLNAIPSRGWTPTKRRALANWIRNAFRELAPTSGVEVTDAHFTKGEPGYGHGVQWEPSQDEPPSAQSLVIAAEIPVFQTAIESYARKQKRSLTIATFPPASTEIDAQIISTGNHRGRQVFLQDFLSYSLNKALLGEARATEAALAAIAKFSASTIPPDNTTLAAFEKAAHAESSVVPVGRRRVLAFSKKDAPLRLTFTPEMELRFVPR